MPSRTRRRNYNGGGPLENCKTWVTNPKSGLPAEYINQCSTMTDILSDVKFAGKSFFGSQPTPSFYEGSKKGQQLTKELWEYEKRRIDKENGLVQPLATPSGPPVPQSWWKKCDIKDANGNFNKIARPGKEPSSECIQQVSRPAVMQQTPVKQLPLCTKYDRLGANAYQNGALMSIDCDSSTLPKCSKWQKDGSTYGKWAVVGMKDGRESFCNVNGLPVDTNNVIRNKLRAIPGTREEAMITANSNPSMYPWVKPENKSENGKPYDITNKEVGRYEPFYGGKRRSRRRSRKSRRTTKR